MQCSHSTASQALSIGLEYEWVFSTQQGHAHGLKPFFAAGFPACFFQSGFCCILHGRILQDHLRRKPTGWSFFANLWEEPLPLTGISHMLAKHTCPAPSHAPGLITWASAWPAGTSISASASQKTGAELRPALQFLCASLALLIGAPQAVAQFCHKGRQPLRVFPTFNWQSFTLAASHLS